MGCPHLQVGLWLILPPPAGSLSAQIKLTTPSSTSNNSRKFILPFKDSQPLPSDIAREGLWKGGGGEGEGECGLWLAPFWLGSVLWGCRVPMSGFQEGSLEGFPFATPGNSVIYCSAWASEITNTVQEDSYWSSLLGEKAVLFSFLHRFSTLSEALPIV